MRTNDESIKFLENSKPIKRQTETDRQTDTGRETDRRAERRTERQLTDRHAGRH